MPSTLFRKPKKISSHSVVSGSAFGRGVFRRSRMHKPAGWDRIVW